METRLIDFVLAFPQADLDINIFMKLPIEAKVHGDIHHVFKLNRYLYGFNQANANWFEHLKKGLE